MPCSRTPFSNLLDTMCKNVLLGYSKSERPRWRLWLRHRPVFSSDKCVERWLSNREWPQFRDVDTFHTILDKIDGKFVPHPPPPPPNQGWENSAFCLLRGFIPDLGGWDLLISDIINMHVGVVFSKTFLLCPKKQTILKSLIQREVALDLGHIYSWEQDFWAGIECFHMTSWRPYWCSKTMKRRPCWCPKPVLWELNSFLMQTLSFVPINLHR